MKLHVFNWLFKVLDLKLKWERNERKKGKNSCEVCMYLNWLFKVLDLKWKWEKND